MKRRWIGIGLAGACAAGALARMVGVATAQTCEVTAGPLHESIVAIGEVVPVAGVANVLARTEGRVTRVYVREGDRVEAGQLLAEMDGAEAEAVVSRLEAEWRAQGASASAVTKGARTQERTAAEAALVSASTELRLAEERLARVDSLHASGSETGVALSEAHGAAEIARAQVEQARARRDLATAGGRSEEVEVAHDRVAAADASLAEARHRLERTRIVAPIAGVVLARRVDEGDTVFAGSGASLFDIADPAKTEIALEVEDQDALRVAEGMDVTISLPGGREVLGTGKVTRVGARLQKRAIAADDARLRAQAQVRSAWVAYAGAPLPIGERIEASVHLPERVVAARVPRDAVHVRDGEAVVEVKHGPIATTQAVTLGAADAAFVEVSGVERGTRVLLTNGAGPR
jgi:multidrug resistance efflux pump